MQAMMARNAAGGGGPGQGVANAAKSTIGALVGPPATHHGVVAAAHQGVFEGGRRLPVTAHVGDWMCPACNTHNFASRTSCFKCGKGRTTGGSEADRDQTITVSVKASGFGRRQDGDFVVGQGFARGAAADTGYQQW